jgi:hypothetical protein
MSSRALVLLIVSLAESTSAGFIGRRTMQQSPLLNLRSTRQLAENPSSADSIWSLSAATTAFLQPISISSLVEPKRGLSSRCGARNPKNGIIHEPLRHKLKPLRMSSLDADDDGRLGLEQVAFCFCITFVLAFMPCISQAHAYLTCECSVLSG